MSGAAIVVLGPGALATAARLRAALPGSAVHGLRSRLDGRVDQTYDDFGAHLRGLHREGRAIVALCAAGIVIRALAAPLAAGDGKRDDPPVLAVAEDGSAVVPLLGGLAGANELARRLAAALAVAPAITTSGELRFGTCLLHPPAGYALVDLEAGKRFVADLLAGEAVRVEGDAPWLAEARLPLDASAAKRVRITPYAEAPAADLLPIHPRSVAVALDAAADEPGPAIVQRVLAALERNGLARAALAVLLAPAHRMRHPGLAAAAEMFGAALRYLDADPASPPAQWLAAELPGAGLGEPAPGLAVAMAAAPLQPERIGRARGSVAVIGLGPGDPDFMIPAAQAALAAATDILGYAPYVAMARPRQDQRSHASDNREELQRARHAFELAAQGRRVAVVSSGDPGVFAMGAAVLEALEQSGDPAWRDVELRILPGVSAALATAALAGAPLGHDFCLISLSDHLKPWDAIERRLRLAGEADLVLGFYNPISRERPWQLERALAIVREHRAADTPVVLGRDVGRPGGQVRALALAALEAAMVDMRSTLIIGSSTTRRYARGDGADWVYTPRWYPAPP